jgi:C_GCAxxG_C_C family probable redox protein
MDDRMIRLIRLSARGLSCAQMLVALALENRGEENPGLVRAAAGLAYGLGSGQEACGAWSGGVLVLGLYAGGIGEPGEDRDRLTLMLQELADWFAERFGAEAGGTSCEALTGNAGPAAAQEKCGRMVADTHDKIVEILFAHGFDPAG